MNCRIAKLLLTLGWTLSLATASALAGGGPENVLLVVNDRSFVSVTLGNYYARLRQLPPSHVLYVSWDRGLDATDVASLRELVLGPVMTTLQQRGLADQIDYVIYSSDFPPAADYEVDMRRAQPPRGDKAIASLTALTFFAQAVLDGEVQGYASLTANHYFQPATGGSPLSQAFSGSAGWAPDGSRTQLPRPRYLLSTMLSVTSGRGISLRESVDSLRVSATADGTAPPGVIYFMVSDDIRTKVRSPLFMPVIADLKQLGVKGETLTGVLPLRRQDVAGAVLGNATLPLGQARMKILPGAICENLTSAGAIFTEHARQTPCTELLKYGAAGASGTVIEPFAIQQKFPTPFIQLHYARGCSLAEAFYQSVQGPFQLLVVGDPLCRPWAKPAIVELAAPTQGATVKGDLELRPMRQGGEGAARWELFVDGRRTAQAPDGAPLRLDTTKLPDGYHELRAVAIDETLIATQSRAGVGVLVDNQGRSVEFSGPARTTWGETLELTANSPGAAAIDIRQGGRSLGLIAASAGKMKLDPRQLGLGPVALRAVALAADKTEYATSAPLALDVGPGAPLPASAPEPPAGLVLGICVVNAAGARQVVTTTAPHKWLEDAGVGGNEDYQIEAWFKVDAADVYQFQARHSGDLDLQVDGASLFSGKSKFDKVAMIPAVLAPGAHRLTIRGHSGGEARLDIRFGGPGALMLPGSRFTCER